mmetsp:Transcript_29041/g.70074  ORF Transcript_29041/g.70074 Transcript_29041/m.70074 type:complete len:259 (-) Transcript_29041:186-962(-)|eukprot:CAMPEP_0113486820 /NCGR_PEP_ID=MMETSP0014_2-20120614/25191_1 /TAXON_ID=2857 /ORGANISM="Nitzschia sp." /LENGTH=258 /DNA_ID=CAMNT_0000380499 /DNA_START=191 /DNA_END=967 /DNA_ORIENTATION=+ /assembly_acc=CAM_ASM_000159
MSNTTATDQLRQRTTPKTTTMNSNDDAKKNVGDNDRFLREPGYGISVRGLIDASPQHHSVVLKLHVPVLYSILPAFIQRFILSWTFLAQLLGPTWKQRYLIVCGSYLYKFKDRASTTPKGSPIDIESLDVEIVRSTSAIGVVSPLPPGYTSTFCVSTFRKKNYYAVIDNEEANVWVQSLLEARQDVITRRMGHANQVPYPKSWTYYDSLGKGLVKTKERVRSKLEESRLREMELSDLGGLHSGGGPGGPGEFPRGYHG